MMRTLLFLTLLTALSVNARAQDRTWESKIAAGFYSRIDANHQFECCDKASKSNRICISIDLPEQCYPRMDFTLSRYVEESIDSTVIERAICLLEKSYRRKFSRRKRAKLKRSCYTVYVFESTIEDLYQEVVFISGQLKMVVNFQSQ